MKKILAILVCLIVQLAVSQTFQEIDNFNRSGTEISYGDNVIILRYTGVF
ncbi:hypothetical protein QW060_18005 [Myroides ceti]|uniref:Uncharacterized protein n=1 Tax=Paenimyroides ceti TaxID=395087 RepID=A0ABT8CXV8_9FLAO|nr:hypothetical protein [Paenimyroides ceti]MDN3708971.1 hypothetical protein [Paenimyroides ceti]